MRVPLSWLREYVRVDLGPGELAERLTTATCEVERVLRIGVADMDGNFDFFRVGRVLEAGRHPNADRLQLCAVDVGEGEPRQIVCGAWNFGAGATVAVALPGAVLPDGTRLEQAKLRGAVSDGMILSERELELGPDHGGILVLPEAEPGTPLVDVLPLSDVVLVVETTPNRPDLLSVYGLAREVTALTGAELAPPPGRDPKRQDDEQVQIEIQDLEGCPRYIGRLFREVSVGLSPLWLRARLHASDMRPISNVVDVTNYVMHALGNPLHAFDFETLGRGQVVVRRARAGEELRTLDGQLRRLEERDLVIADADRAVALAGIMGGADTEVGGQTTTVLLEAANFEPIGILRTSECLGLRTQGSNRWEKGVDPYLAEQAARYATELLVELAGGRWTGEAEARSDLPARPVIQLRPERTDAVLGLETASHEQRRLLERLGFVVGEDWTVTVPTWRARDVTREIDLVEEVARFRLDEVPFTLPRRSVMFGRLTTEQRLRRLVEEVLVGCGLSEAYTPSLTAEDPDPAALRVPVPLSAEYSVLRTTLIPSLLQAVRRNVDAGNEDVGLFEVARVYLPGPGPLPDEPWRVGAVLEGGFFRVRGIVETLCGALKVEPALEAGEAPFLHPGQTARLQTGVVGALRPGVLEGAWGAFELDLATLLAAVPERVLYEDVISFPPMRQDVDVVVDVRVPAARLAGVARKAGGAELHEVRVFDVFRGEQIPAGKKSVTLALVFQSPERTLSSEEAGAMRERIVRALHDELGAELRT
jgi:phenylalanyl-tRNA synthetase beta chain